MELVIRDHFAGVTGKKVVEVHAMLQHPKYPFMIADVDGITTDDKGNLVHRCTNNAAISA